jgi:V8-like Glu-specific endopeptidase
MSTETEQIKALYDRDRAAEALKRLSGPNGPRPAAAPGGKHQSVGSDAGTRMTAAPSEGSLGGENGSETVEAATHDKRPRAKGRAAEAELLDAYWGSYGDPSIRAAARSSEVVSGIETVIGTDDRSLVTATSSYPWRAIASLIITAPDGEQFIGTAWLVAPRLMLTAGHCVYMHDHGGWASSIEIIPGRNGSERPFGSCFALSYRSTNGWVDDHDREYDYAALLLPEDCRYGDQLGWFGRQVRSDAELANVTLNLSGYPGDKPTGTQWRHTKTIKSLSGRVITYEIDTFGGQSGAPVWLFIPGQGRFGVGIHTNGSLAGNSATRITADVEANIAAWVAEVP